MKEKMILMVALLLLSSCAVTKDIKIDETAVFEFKTYGGFVPQEMATQILTIDKDKIVFRYYDSSNKLTKEYTKATDSVSFSALIAALNDGNFAGMDSEYVPKAGDPMVTDVGTGEFTLTTGDKKKVVKVDPYFEDYMPESLKKINQILLKFRQYALTTTREDSLAISEKFILSSKTYMNGGAKLSLKGYLTEESFPEMSQLTYEFTSSHSGYGESKAADQVITTHTIVISIYAGEITEAIVDGKWDEINSLEVETDGGFVTMSYQPKQCEVLPWKKWKDESLIMWAKEPTEEEVVMTYLGSLEIDAVNFQKVDSGKMVCQACDTCPTSYYYTIEVSEGSADKMRELGWN